MKKVFAIMAISCIMVACGNSSDSKDAKKDTTTTPTMDTTKKMSDTTKMMSTDTTKMK